MAMLKVAASAALLLSTSFTVASAAPKLLEFNAPDAIETHANGIDAKGDIGGYYIDNQFAGHGFVRSGKNNYVVFTNGDYAPEPLFMNASGQQTGYSFASDGFYRGFLSQNDGSYEVFQAGGTNTNTVGTAIGPKEDVAGNWTLNNAVRRGFLRDAKGVVTLFDCIGGTFDSRQGTYPSVVTKKGAIYGSCVDKNWNSHGFSRNKAGKLNMIDLPEAGTGGFQGTTLVGVNSKGTLGGLVIGNDNQPHPFLRPVSGNTIVFTIPNASTNDMTVTGLNDHDELVGYFQDAHSSALFHSFICEPDGTITVFDSPSAGGQGKTLAQAINNKGWVVGSYSDGNDGGGFLRKP